MKSDPLCHCYENAFGFIGDCPVHDVKNLSAKQVEDAARLVAGGMSASDAYRIAAMNSESGHSILGLCAVACLMLAAVGGCIFFHLF